ncbi:hypothetical protein AB0F68_15440 [Micromonospora sp. NPDC023966]|uniref:hypothetical protein n=1 Tax=Micromonospora sp. NPDC023966 TaxID=3154699 RepID=UPI0033D36059
MIVESVRIMAAEVAVVWPMPRPRSGSAAMLHWWPPTITEKAVHDSESGGAPGTELAARLAVEPIMVPGTHEAMLTHPDDVARALLANT